MLMNSSNLLLIVFAELAALLLVVSIFLGVQNHSLRRLVAQLKDKAQGILGELKQAKLEAKAAQKALTEQAAVDDTPPPNYLELLEEQIELTRTHHSSLNSGQDIVLDIAPESPLVHRTPALRHAMLLAEKNALAQIQNGEAPDWDELAKRYETIFNFYEDFQGAENTPEAGADSAELEAVQTELENAKKRVSNLEKFKQLYFDLEEKWQNSKAEAQTHFENLTSITSNLENGEEVQNALQDYHQSYNDFSTMLEQGIEAGTTVADAENKSDALDAALEIKKLRAVASDQHKIIEGLQKQLMSAKTEDERHNVVVDLQGELQKQMRFVQESETCIQLLEDELNTAHSDIEVLKAKVNQLPEVKADYIDLRRQYDEMETKYHLHISENRKLQKKLQAASSSSTDNSASAAEAARLRKELAEASSKYNELEEKYLDLKMNQ